MTENHTFPPTTPLESNVCFGVHKTHQAEIAIFLIFGFVVSTNTVEKKDGGLSFGDV